MTDSEDTIVNMGQAGKGRFLDARRRQYIIARALHLAVKFLSVMPPDARSERDGAAMQRMLIGSYPDYAEMFQVEDETRAALFRGEDPFDGSAA